MQRLFGIEYLPEAYEPAAKGECGCFGMPVLAGTEITGRVSKGTAAPKAASSVTATTPPP